MKIFAFTMMFLSIAWLGFVLGEHFGTDSRRWRSLYETSQAGWEAALKAGADANETTKKANANTEMCISIVERMQKR